MLLFAAGGRRLLLQQQGVYSQLLATPAGPIDLEIMRDLNRCVVVLTLLHSHAGGVGVPDDACHHPSHRNGWHRRHRLPCIA